MREPPAAHDLGPDLTEEFFARATRGDSAWAITTVATLRGRGHSVHAVVHDLLAPTMHKIGHGWEHGTLTVASEHAASAVVEAALSVAAAPHYAPAPTTNDIRVAMACAVGEWHLLPARMAAEALRAHGADVVFLAASPDPAALTAFLTAQPFTALAVSSTMATNLFGAAATIAAGHAAGVPVMVGGSAWGHDSARADALGADHHVRDIAEAMTVLRAWAQEPPRTFTPTLIDEKTRAVHDTADAVAEQAMGALPDGTERLADVERRYIQTGLAHVARSAAAAHLVNDPSVLQDALTWITRVLLARTIPRTTFAAAHRQLVEITRHIHPGVSDLIRTATPSTADPPAANPEHQGP